MKMVNYSEAEINKIRETQAQCRDFIKKCLSYQANKRMTCAESLQHAWLSSYEEDFPELKFKGVYPPGTVGSAGESLLENSLSMSKDDLLSL